MIAILVTLFAKIGIRDRFQKAAAWLTAIIGTILLAVLCWLLILWMIQRHDARVIDAHEAHIGALATAKADEATQAADDADAGRRAAMAETQAETTKALNNAEAKDPEGAKAAAGPVSRAAADSLRNRAAKDGTASH